MALHLKMLTSKFMKKLHTIYYLTGKWADGATYVDCMLREGLRHQLAKN